jgi:two-component system response regulator CpxR
MSDHDQALPRLTARAPEISMYRILLADDDVELCDMLTEYLHGDGFRVEAAYDGDMALAKAHSGAYDLMVLDVMMPRKSGFDVLRKLRMQSLVPVLMLTARGDDVDSIVGLELGADDYLAKPCNPRVLVARIRAILRRAESRPTENNASAVDFEIKDVQMHTGTRSVLCRGEPTALTSTEYCVLEVLLRGAGHVVPKTELSKRALGRELTRYDRSLDMHVSNLRHKLGPLDDGQERIKTVRGVGYQYIC